MGLTAVGTVRSHALVAQGGSSSMCTSRRHVAVGMTVRRGHGDRCCNAGAAGLVVVDLHGGLCLDAFARGRRHRVRAFLLVGGVGDTTQVIEGVFFLDSALENGDGVCWRGLHRGHVLHAAPALATADEAGERA